MDDLTFTTQSALLHHGIEGQKWGVMNGPPYPLDSYLSTGKSLRKAARKEAKAGSKEYSNAKKAAKNYKANMKLAKNIYKDSTNRKVKKAYKAQYKNYKAKYKNAKAEMDKNKQNSQAAKEVLKSLENKSLSEVEQFLKDRGYTTESISKLAFKDYKKEQRAAGSTKDTKYLKKEFDVKSGETKIHQARENEAKFTRKLRKFEDEYRDMNDEKANALRNNKNGEYQKTIRELAKEEMKNPKIKDSNGKPYTDVNKYIKEQFGNWDYYESDTLDMVVEGYTSRY